MHISKEISPTYEMYLKILLRLMRENPVVRVRDLAKNLGVTLGTVSLLLKKMERAGLVVHERYGAVQPTPAGMQVGECVTHRFETIKTFLIEVLGVSTTVAEIDACMMEHAVSPATINRLDTLQRLIASQNIDVEPMYRIQPPDCAPACSECESIGACKAEVALKLSAQ